jgi:translocation and assembly module TamB
MARFSGLAGRPLGGAAMVSLRGQVAPLTGAFDLAAELATIDLTVDVPEADNLLAGRAAITLDAARTVEGTELRRLAVEAGTLGLSAQGRLDGVNADLTARLRLSDLGRLGSGYTGSLGLDLGLRQRAEDVLADLSGEVVDLRIGARPGAAQVAGLFAGRTRLDGRVGLRAGVLRIEDLVLDGPQLAVGVSGVASDTAQTLALRLDRLALAPLVPGLAGVLTGRADLAGPEGARRLTAELSSQGALRSGVAEVDAMLARGVRAGLAAAEEGGGLRLERFGLTATGFDLAAQGQLGADGGLAFTLDGGLDSLARIAPGLEGAARLSGRIARPAGAQDIDARLALDGPSGLALALAGRIAPDFRLALGIEGTVEAGIANAFIAPANVQGTVRLDGSVNGPPALSSLRLSARVVDGRYVLPGSGAAFGDIAASADLAGGTARVQATGSALRGGTVAAEGTVTLLPALAVDLGATATALRIAQPRLFEGVVSGSLRVAGSLVTGPTASGRVTIDEAEIRIPNSPLSRWGVVPDGLRHVGEGAASRQTRANAGLAQPQAAADVRSRPRLPLFLDLELAAPGRIFVRGRGLDAELGGTLRLAGTTTDTIPSGAFTLIRGRLDLLGNRFTLTDGSASFIGSFLPVVRLVASTESGGVVTSVVLEGPVDAPEIRFESVPELPQDEVLARLLFGRALSTLSPFQAAQLGLSLATLTGRSESSFIDRTRRALGLDDLDFTSDADGTTALRAGRYIGERVYTDVSVNSAGRSEVRLQLDLSPRLTLRGRADSEGRSGVGLFFERDY